MPTYVYKDLVTGETFEHFASMKSEALTVSPTSGNPVSRVPQPLMMAKVSGGETIGSIAEKNTQKMIDRGDPRVQPKKEFRPWWRKNKKKPVDAAKWSERQKKRYIREGKQP